MAAPALSLEIKISDEVFIATALLQRENPHRQDLTVDEIVSRVSAENLHGRLRPGVRTHVSQHCVANKEPNPGIHRILYATGTGTRRLLRSTDDVHPARTGKIWPSPDEIPSKYHDLIDWGRKQYGSGGDGSNRWLGGILEMRGLGRELWKDEDPDEYVRRLRENWD